MEYTMKLTEKQLQVIYDALEEYFRLRMGQETDLIEYLAFMDVDEDAQDEPGYMKTVEEAMITREHLSEVMKAFFRIAFSKGYGVRTQAPAMLIAEDIWRAIRQATGEANYPETFFGPEPVPEITKTNK